METLFREFLKTYRRNIVIDLLEKSNCKVIEILGTGAFSEVLSIEDKNNQNIAAKIIDEKSANVEEIRLWPSLQHPNIQMLFNIFRFRDIYICTMPIQSSTLETVIEDQMFLDQPYAFSKIRSWFKDILMGLDYLQFHKLSHLDIKTNSVLISNNNKAIICDFTCLSRSAKPVLSHGSPYHLRPPEACENRGLLIPVEGGCFDSWTTGMMFLECITKDVYGKSLRSGMVSWINDLYTVLIDILQEDAIYKYISQAFPSSGFSKADLEIARNFILMFLQFNPENRPTAKKALTHKFFNRKAGDMYKGDRIWKKKMGSCWLNNFISKYRINLLFKVFPEDCTCEMCVKMNSRTAFDRIIHIDEDEMVDFFASQASN